MYLSEMFRNVISSKALCYGARNTLKARFSTPPQQKDKYRTVADIGILIGLSGIDPRAVQRLDGAVSTLIVFTVLRRFPDYSSLYSIFLKILKFLIHGKHRTNES